MTQTFDSAPHRAQAPVLGSSSDANQAMAVVATLDRHVRSGAANFFWIDGLSVINSLLAFFGSDTRFVVGLGITQFIDAIAQVVSQDIPDAKAIITGVGFALDLGLIALLALFGVFAAKRHRWAFIAGMIIYSLDAVLMLYFKDWVGFGFHLFFLWRIFNGLRALEQLQKFKMSKPLSDFPQNIGV